MEPREEHGSKNNKDRKQKDVPLLGSRIFLGSHFYRAKVPCLSAWQYFPKSSREKVEGVLGHYCSNSNLSRSMQLIGQPNSFQF